MNAEVVAYSYGITRSPQWEQRAKQHLQKQPHCLACGKKQEGGYKLNVHHKFPFHMVVTLGRPDLELDERNLYTLCVEHDEEHHLLLGHLGCFESYNPWLEQHLGKFGGLLASQIKSTWEYIRAEKCRPKPLKEMTQHDKDAFLVMLCQLMPVLNQ